MASPPLARAPKLREGALVAKRFVLEAPLGEGGMGIVWSAKTKATGRAVALKFLKAREGETSQRFLREARIAGMVDHPNVCAAEDAFDLSDGTFVLVMERLDGTTLARAIAERGKLPFDEAASLLLPVVSALQAAHARGVVHRDLKPENVFLAKGGVKVLDFGIAKFMGDVSTSVQELGMTTTGTMLGTPHYMAPEQIFGDPIGFETDLWALGVILFEALTGSRPFVGDNPGQVFRAITAKKTPDPRELVPNLPRSAAELVRRLLDKDPARRATLEEVETVLRGGTLRMRRPKKRTALVVAAAIAAPAFVLGMLIATRRGGDGGAGGAPTEPRPLTMTTITPTPPKSDSLLGAPGGAVAAVPSLAIASPPRARAATRSIAKESKGRDPLVAPSSDLLFRQ